jgi:hypothetical protein
MPIRSEIPGTSRQRLLRDSNRGRGQDLHSPAIVIGPRLYSRHLSLSYVPLLTSSLTRILEWFLGYLVGLALGSRDKVKMSEIHFS